MQKFVDFQRSFLRLGRTGVIGGRVVVVLGLVALFSVIGLMSGGKMAFASSYCSSTSRYVVVQPGDTLSAIAARYNTSWQAVAVHNHIANPNVINVGRQLCIPYSWSNGHTPNLTLPTTSASSAAVKGQSNPFPYGQCTWWASERYHQLTGIYVPWTTQSDAWEWTARAHDFHWNVSSKPTVGAIMDLQPYVQGAYGYGHVAVVEQILSNGHVIASSMNWGSNPDQVTDAEFTPGSGVTFITF